MWTDGSSGRQLSTLLESRARSLGIAVHVTVTEWEPGHFGVSVDWASDPEGLLMEVSDRVDGVRLLDPHGDDVSVDEALDYFAARLSGATRRQATASVWPPRPRWWRRRNG